MRVYRSIKDNKGPKKSGRGAQNYKFSNRLNGLFGHKPINTETGTCVEVGIKKSELKNDPILPSTSASENVSDNTLSDITESDNFKESSSEKTKTPLQKKSKSTFREECKNKRHKEKMELEKEKLAIEKKKVELLQCYL